MKPEPTCLLGHCSVLVCTDISLSTVRLGSRPQGPSSVDRFLENGLNVRASHRKAKRPSRSTKCRLPHMDRNWGAVKDCRSALPVSPGPKPRFGIRSVTPGLP